MLVDIFEFIRANAALLSLCCLVYCVWRIRQIEKRTAAIRFMLFRDYDGEIPRRDLNPLSPTRN